MPACVLDTASTVVKHASLVVPVGYTNSGTNAEVRATILDLDGGGRVDLVCADWGGHGNHSCTLSVEWTGCTDTFAARMEAESDDVTSTFAAAGSRPRVLLLVH